MMLKNLKIYSTNGNLDDLKILKMIRDVTFKEGLNLIIDSDGSEGRGNDIGKTTFIDLIDLCLGASDKSVVYADKETKKSNKKINIVQSFIENKKVVVELQILHHKIVRPLFETSPKELVLLNGEKKNLKELKNVLCEALFGVSSEDIKYRSLLAKFIRNDKKSMDNAVDYLNPYAKNEEKHSIRLFLFGYRGTKKTKILEKLKSDLNNNENIKAHYKKDGDYNENQLNVLIEVEQKERERLKNNISELGTETAIVDLLEKSNVKKAELSNTMQEYEALCFRIKQNIKSIEILNRKKSTIQASTLQGIYNETKKYVPELQKTFEEFIVIHNNTINNEKIFIEENLKKLTQEKNNLEEKIKIISKENLSLELIKKIQDISEELSLANEKIGKYQERKDAIEKVVLKIDELKNEIEKIEEEINSELESFNENIVEFNLIYSDYQKLVYGESVKYLSEDKEKGFDIFSDKSKSGDGQKKGEVILFDLAYNKLSTEKQIKVPKFIVHDQLELTDIEPKRIIFCKILPTLDCQFIVPTIRSSIVTLGTQFIDDKTILSLSKEDKIFKIEEYDNLPDYISES